MESIVRRSRTGLSRSAVRAQLAAGRWQVVTPTVLATHNGPLTRRQMLRAAVLTARSGSALGALTGLELHGLQGWTTDRIQVVVPRGGGAVSWGSLSVECHESRRLPTRPTRRGGLPVLSAARCAVDAAAWGASDRAGCALLAAVVQQRLTRPADLRAVLDGCLRLSRRRLLVGVIDDIAGGAEALSELDFLRFCGRHGLPRPVGQAVRRDARGRRRYVDATFVCRSGRSLRVEVDGSIHLVGTTYWADMRRGNDLALAHELVLRFPSWAIRADDPDVALQISRALAA